MKKPSVTSSKSKHSSRHIDKPNANRAKQNKPSGQKTAQKGKGLHPRNRHKAGYDFPILTANCPKLKPLVSKNAYGNLSIDFADPQAVKLLNAALLSHDYQIVDWDIPQGFLCPPVPGRVDYLHYLADLLASNTGKVPKGAKVRVLDIGTGANGIYPLLGSSEYGWQFVASDIDPDSLANLAKVLSHNPKQQQLIELRQQGLAKHIFTGIISKGESFDLTMCNPPFHASLAEALQGNQKKVTNLAANQAKRSGKQLQSVTTKLNFGGQKAELWCDGGEKRFLQTMIVESKDFAHQCLWFTSLISKKENLKPCLNWLKQVKAEQVKVIEMAQGNKKTRVLAWSYLNEQQRELWQKYRN